MGNPVIPAPVRFGSERVEPEASSDPLMMRLPLMVVCAQSAAGTARSSRRFLFISYVGVPAQPWLVTAAFVDFTITARFLRNFQENG